MPMYAYACESCGEHHEHLQKFNEPAAPCPKCGSGSEKQTKQISTGTGFCLMGRDWHRPGMKASHTGIKDNS